MNILQMLMNGLNGAGGQAGNPLDMLTQYSNDPAVKKAIAMLKDKPMSQWGSVAENLAKSQGTTSQDILNKLGVGGPK